MRDLLIGAVLLYFAARSLGMPWIGIMFWTFVSIMNPHQISWRFNSLPVAMTAALLTLGSMLVSKEPKRLPMTREVIVLLLFMAWMTITFLANGDYNRHYPGWNKVMKIDFMILIALVVLYSRQHMVVLAWVLVISIGYWGVKGGAFTIMTGGNYRVWGPPTSFIEGNNELALALIMTIPLMRFLQIQANNKWIKRALAISMLLCAASAIGTHSRGALLAIVAMGTVLWWRGDKKIVTGLVILVLAGAVWAFMPAHWFDRMETIQTYQEDESAMGRIRTWITAYNVANDRFFGAGFGMYNAEIFARYAPNPEEIRAAHSIYFQILGEHGWVGLGIYLLMWFFVWSSAGKLRKLGRAQPETKWISDLGSMCQVSMVGFATGGAFLSLAYFDLPYNILVLVVLARVWLARRAWETEPVVPGKLAYAFGVSHTLVLPPKPDPAKGAGSPAMGSPRQPPPVR